MIDINLKYQIALFGNYEDISPKPDILKYFIDKFSNKELIPTTFQELGPKGVANRFSFTSNDGLWLIEFSTNRLDIHKVNKNIGVTKVGDVNEFIAEAKEIVEIIDAKYPKKHNRLSLITRYLLEEMDDKDMSQIYRKLNNTIDIYKDHNIADWNNRTVARIPFDVDEKSELFNVISEVKRTIGNHNINSKIEKIDRIELFFDLNTFQGNTEYRFDYSSFTKFLDTVEKLEADLREKYIKLIEG